MPAITLVPLTVSADPPSLFWQAKLLRGSNTEECLAVAQSTVEKHAWLSDVHRVRYSLWASSTSDSLTVSVGCLQGEPDVTAVIMVAGADAEKARKLRDSLVDKWPVQLDSGAATREIPQP
jgi:hypothetical protein